ncbi:MAG: hypothetical protein AB1716_12920 [Planctomycetota bacterium]
MSLWILMVGAAAVGGALVLWHSVSRSKAISEEMLRQYAAMLADARRCRAHELAQQNQRAEEDRAAGPP